MCTVYIGTYVVYYRYQIIMYQKGVFYTYSVLNQHLNGQHILCGTHI